VSTVQHGSIFFEEGPNTQTKGLREKDNLGVGDHLDGIRGYNGGLGRNRVAEVNKKKRKSQMGLLSGKGEIGTKKKI